MRIFADTADLAEIERLAADDRIHGITTNPTLYKNLEGSFRKYGAWAADAVKLANGKPISIDGPPEKVWELGENAIPKVCVPLDEDWKKPQGEGLLNFTAICSDAQLTILNRELPKQFDIISFFCGRLTDVGYIGIQNVGKHKGQYLWASTREIGNYYQAESSGFDIITMAPELIDKMWLWRGLSPDDIATMTIQQFDDDRPEW